MPLVKNEQTKLTASWLNGISAASIAVGGFAQLAPLLTGANAPSGPAGVLWFSTIWIVFGLALHNRREAGLERLEGMTLLQILYAPALISIGVGIVLLVARWEHRPHR